ncbi:unnamed protein product [Tetraodon nigroviridis]|uniref:(spotted green pufferfish) hypothetical protein n=1 Tax=Tetraodon nigroviridis TaxID=99883 RepID=Q4SEK8_TETNG|nr:unnamed protein product [Tetraodon nigroviridis]
MANLPVDLRCYPLLVAIGDMVTSIGGVTGAVAGGVTGAVAGGDLNRTDHWPASLFVCVV